jgi:hypothetical protein
MDVPGPNIDSVRRLRHRTLGAGCQSRVETVDQLTAEKSVHTGWQHPHLWQGPEPRPSSTAQPGECAVSGDRVLDMNLIYCHSM